MQLEGLVLQLMHWKEKENPEGQSNNKSLTPPEDSRTGTESSTNDDSSIDASRGAFSNDIHGLSYVGPTHWEAVIDTVLNIRLACCSITERYLDKWPQIRTCHHGRT